MVHAETGNRSPGHDGLWQYFGLTFATSWLAWGAMILFQMPGGSVNPDLPPPTPPGLVLLALGGFAPSLAGVLMTWRCGGRAGMRDLLKRCVRFNLGVRPYLVIVLSPAVIGSARLAVQWLRGGDVSLPAPLTQPLLLAGFAVQLLLFGPVSEELGWRGFALDRLLQRWSGLRASLTLGVLHALWHLPLFFVPGTIQQRWGDPLFHFGMFVLGTLGGAVVFTWLHRATRGSVWAAIMYHLTANCSVSLVWLSFGGGKVDLFVMALASMAVAAGLVLVDRGRWAQWDRSRSGSCGAG